MTLSREEKRRKYEAKWHNLGAAIERAEAKEREERQRALRRKVFNLEVAKQRVADQQAVPYMHLRPSTTGGGGNSRLPIAARYVAGRPRAR